MQGLIEVNRVRCVGVVDDDELGREELMDNLRDRDFEPVAVTGPYGLDLDRLVGDLMSHSPEFVICDHRLQAMGLASFYGLAVVRRLLEQGQPAMLLTQYQNIDRTRMELRSARHWAPLIMGRSNFQVDRLPQYLDIIQREMNGNPVDHRRTHRTLIQVEYVDPSTGDMEAIVPSWLPEQAVTVPADCIDSAIRGRLQPGDLILGEVNIGAASEEDLFFKNLSEIVSPKAIRGIP